MSRLGPSGEPEAGEQSFSFDYTVMTDDTGLLGNRLQHRVGAGVQQKIGEAGYLGLRSCLNFNNGPLLQNEVGGGDLRKADYTAYWLAPIRPLDMVVEAGWTARTFPQFRGDAAYTHEWYVSLGFNDRKLFGVKEPVLSPYLTYYRDMDDFKGGWLDVGISHAFALKQSGLENTPVLKDITLTPSFLVGVDDGQMGRQRRLSSLRYGVDVSYDLSNALKMPEEQGKLYLTGFLYYSDALVNPLPDRLYGGVGLSYRW